jgi:hypothetical protein
MMVIVIEHMTTGVHQCMLDYMTHHTMLYSISDSERNRCDITIYYIYLQSSIV